LFLLLFLSVSLRFFGHKAPLFGVDV